MQACCAVTPIGGALLTIRRPGANPVEKIKLQLVDVTVTSLSTGGSGGEDKLTENISLAFRSLKIFYVYEPAGAPVQNKAGGWDFIANSKT
jgi:type VI secretion system secreted protein Hcp